MPGGDAAVQIGVGEEGLPADAEVKRESRAHFPGVLREQREPVEAGIAVFARALSEVVELAHQKIRERIAGERRGRTVKCEPSVATEIIRHVVGGAAVLAANAELMAPLG